GIRKSRRTLRRTYRRGRWCGSLDHVALGRLLGDDIPDAGARAVGHQPGVADVGVLHDALAGRQVEPKLTAPIEREPIDGHRPGRLVHELDRGRSGTPNRAILSN